MLELSLLCCFFLALLFFNANLFFKILIICIWSFLFVKNKFCFLIPLFIFFGFSSIFFAPCEQKSKITIYPVFFDETKIIYHFPNVIKINPNTKEKLYLLKEKKDHFYFSYNPHLVPFTKINLKGMKSGKYDQNYIKVSPYKGIQIIHPSFLFFKNLGKIRENIENKLLLKKNNLSYMLFLFYLGNTYFLNPIIKQDFQILGISHLFALSGIHIGILIGLLLSFINFKKRSFLKILFFIVFLLIYIFMTNQNISLYRAYFMFILYEIFLFFHQKDLLVKSFLGSIFCVLLFAPYAFKEISFLLSYTCVFALLFIAPLLEDNYLNFLPSKVKKLFSYPLSIQICTLPLSLYFFSQFSFFALFFNLVLIFPFTLLFSLTFCYGIIYLYFPSFPIFENMINQLWKFYFEIVHYLAQNHFLYYHTITNQNKVYAIASFMLLISFLLYTKHKVSPKRVK